MMKLLQMICLMALVLMGCKSKQAIKKKKISTETTTELVQKDSLKDEQRIEEKKEEKKVDLVHKKQEQKTEIEVKGKAETDKPIEIYQVENGDTVQAVRVIGNADVYIRTQSSRSEEVKKEEVKESFSNKIEQISRAVVKEKNLKKAATAVKESTKEVTTHNSTFGVYITWILAFAVVACLIWLYYSLGGRFNLNKIKDALNRKR